MWNDGQKTGKAGRDVNAEPGTFNQAQADLTEHPPGRDEFNRGYQLGHTDGYADGYAAAWAEIGDKISDARKRQRRT